MDVLVIDTSSAAVTAAIVQTEGARARTVAERVTINARRHGELLAPAIAECLAEAGRTPRDLGAIVAGLGPGPFTGLRVGLVSAAVMADTLHIPVYGVCSLDGIGLYPAAAASRPDGPASELLVAADARRKEVYWATYRDGERIEGPSVGRPADIPAGFAAAAGAGARMYADVLGVPVRGPDHPDARTLVTVALQRLSAGAPSEVLTPLYLRRPDAVPAAARKPVTP